MHPEQAIAALRFDPLLPVWLIVALGGARAAGRRARRYRGARAARCWRLAAFAVLLLWLAGPRLVQETRETLPDIGLLVVDQTASMQVGDRARLAEAAARRDRGSRRRSCPTWSCAPSPCRSSGDAGTRLFGAIDRALADIPRSRLAGTIAITDGQIHDIPDTAPGGAPLNVLIPAKGEETDRRLRVIEAPGYGIVGKSVTLRVAIEDLGVAHPRRHRPNLTIRRDGEPPRVENVPIGVEQQIEVPITRAGPTVVELSADPLPGEVSTLNNRAVVEINGVRDRLRVLLISGEPHPGERTWRRLLKADPSVDLVHFTILRPPEKDDLTPLNELALIAFPVRELFLDKIDEFDLIILDRFQNRGLLPLPYHRQHRRACARRRRAAAERRAGVLRRASLAATPLGAVLPGAPAPFNAVVDGRFRPRVTELGQRHPVTEGLAGANPPDKPERAADLGLLVSPHRAGRRARRGADAARRTAQPLLVLDRVGKGRVALLLSDQIWLWSRGHQGGGPQAELLRRVAHWLMQEPELEENALTAQVADGRLTIERRSTDPGAARPRSR